MKNVDKVVENRIEKHLDLVEHNKAYYTEAKVLNTSGVLPITISGEEKDTDFQYARENLYDIIENYKKINGIILKIFLKILLKILNLLNLGAGAQV